MRDMNERPLCHRAEDLVSYLYGEAGEADALDFRSHLERCDACRSEFAIFNQVHESILLWRNEALGASFNPAAVTVDPITESSRFVRHERKLSAFAALREFFSVSPLWLRGATAFAGLLLCVLVVFAISRSWERPVEITKDIGEPKIFTQSDLNKAVAEAKRQAVTTVQQAAPEQSGAQQSDPELTLPQSPRVQFASNRSTSKPRVKSLTRQEREQLAADLRLNPSADDEELTEQENPR